MTPPYRIIISPESSRDLQAIYEYVAQDSPRNAANLIERILDAIESLSAFPRRTVAEHINPGIKHPVRSLPIRP